MRADFVREHSLFYRAYRRAADYTGSIYGGSSLYRALNSSRDFGSRLAAGSSLVHFLRYSGGKALRGGACAALLAKAYSLLDRGFAGVSSFMSTYGDGSLFLRVLGGLKRETERSWIRACCEILLGFAAAGFFVRLYLGAYSTFSLGFFSAAALIFLYLRFQEGKLETAFENSFFYRQLRELLKSNAP